MSTPAYSDEDDLLDVMEELASFDKTRYCNIGTGLRLRTAELDSIESSCQQNHEKALRKVVTAWLQKHYNVDKFGPPTWQMLVKGVHSPAGGNDYTLAKKIASNHPASASEWVMTKFQHYLFFYDYCFMCRSSTYNILHAHNYVNAPTKAA